MFHRHRTTIVEIAGVSWYCANYCWFPFIVVWSFFSVFLIFCITSVGEKSPQHQETTGISDPVLVRSILQAEPGADLEGGCRGCAPSPEMTCGFLIQLVFCKNKKTMWFIGVEVEQETSASPPKKILERPREHTFL